MGDKDEDTDLTREIKGRIRDNLQTRYSDAETMNFLNLCSFLDPRFKAEFSSKNKVMEQVRKKMEQEIFSQTKSQDKSQSVTEEPPPKKGKFSQIFRQHVSTSPETTLTTEERISQELAAYTCMQLPVPDIDDSPLDWWKSEASRLPTLSTVVRKNLSACANSVALSVLEVT